VHPRPIFQAILDFQMPQDLVEGMGYPEVTDAMKRKFVGENFFRLHGKDVGEYMAKVEGDRWDVRRQEEGQGGEMWAHARARIAGEAVVA
jgi:hypothetical protein